MLAMSSDRHANKQSAYIPTQQAFNLAVWGALHKATNAKTATPDQRRTLIDSLLAAAVLPHLPQASDTMLQGTWDAAIDAQSIGLIVGARQLLRQVKKAAELETDEEDVRRWQRREHIAAAITEAYAQTLAEQVPTAARLRAFSLAMAWRLAERYQWHTDPSAYKTNRRWTKAPTALWTAHLAQYQQETEAAWVWGTGGGLPLLRSLAQAPDETVRIAIDRNAAKKMGRWARGDGCATSTASDGPAQPSLWRLRQRQLTPHCDALASAATELLSTQRRIRKEALKYRHNHALNALQFLRFLEDFPAAWSPETGAVSFVASSLAALRASFAETRTQATAPRVAAR